MTQQPRADDVEEVVVPGVAALAGILLTGLLYLVLPTNVIIGPNWLLLVIEGVFVIPLLIDILTPWDLSHMARRMLVLVPLSLSTLALAVGVALFVFTLATNTNANNLLRGGALLWSFNILVFALWYWEIDGEGPWKRHLSGQQPGDFLFPQQTNDFPLLAHKKRWMPHFFDYLFVAFTGATALSPADTYPLTRKAKPPSSSEGKTETPATPTIPLQTQFEQLQSSEQGLTSEEAQQRVATYGTNDTVSKKRDSGLVQFLRLFLNPLILILLLASLITAILGDRIDASLIFVIVLLSNILNFVQTYRSQKAVDQLGASVAPTATALRDGEWIEIPRSHLVPGDMIRLTAGDLVPADARLVQTNELQVQQAALTGESQPVEKTADDLSVPTERLAEVHNRVFLGTSVMSGSATALVTATGRTTAFGDIAASLASKPPQTEFERGMTSFSLLIVRTVLFLVLFIFPVGIIGHWRRSCLPSRSPLV